MALFNGLTRVDGSRSHTALIKSGHMSPAEHWILDPAIKSLGGNFASNGKLIDYQYGGPGMTEVVIPKGRVVGITAPVKNFQTKKWITPITYPGIALSNNVIGMVPYNITVDYFQIDKFGGNQPSIITTDYIELPFISDVAAKASNTWSSVGLLAEEAAITTGLKNPWGAVVRNNAGVAPVVGDYLMATPSGRLTKWDGANAMAVVGQILAQDFNQEPWGWMKWAMWDETVKFQDDVYVNKSGASNLPGDAGYPFDPAFANGTLDMNGYLSQYTTNPTGIPNLHDGEGNYAGYGKNDTDFTTVSVGRASNLTTTGITAGEKGTTVKYQLLDNAGGPARNIQSLARTNILINNVALSDASLATVTLSDVNLAEGTFKLALPSTAVITAGHLVTASYKVYNYGTPTAWDFKGVVGAFRILLKR